MISYEKALRNIFKNTRRLPTKRILVEDSSGRALSGDIYSKIAMPPFDKAAMDGYALRAQDTKDVTAELRCVGLIQAGEAFKNKIKAGECVKIMTGARLPEGADSVIMVENTQKYNGCVRVLKTVKRKENVCFQGEDLRQGQKVLERGTKISSSHVAILATVGLRCVEVIAEPKVAILNTGGEIVPPGHKLSANKIYNSNGPMLGALLKSDGIRPCFLGIVRDNVKDLAKAMEKGLKADVFLISGGVSMGDYDLVPEALRNMGTRRIFHKVNIKPGKPLFFGMRKNTIVFGIPGNPVSNFLTYLIFIRPALYKMMGRKDYRPVFKEGILKKELSSKSVRKHFVLAKITNKGNHYYLNPITSHGSADTLALSKADAFIVMDENSGIIKNNSRVKFITWKTI